MKLIRILLDQHEKLFAKGTKLERLYPLHEALDTFAFTPDKVTDGPSHIRDGVDIKRIMGLVVVALLPCILMACYNTGLQANQAIQDALANGGGPGSDWQVAVMKLIGLGFSPQSFISCFVFGALYFAPVMIVSYAVGGLWEVLFACVRRHEINEGFLVTGMLFPLILPPGIPLWQVALGISFGVVIGKEIFGGTGMNFLNPALTARVFLFFAYPAQISGDLVWVAGAHLPQIDGYSMATPLAVAAESGMKAMTTGDVSWTWAQSFLGFLPGSMGETSALACLLGAALLILTQTASWRTMAGVAVGTVLTCLLFNGLAAAQWVDNPMFAMPFWWHMVLGGWAFGTVFMATDPVTSSFTERGKYIFGFGIGLMVVLIRVVNPAFPEGMMLAILFMNIFAAFIDYVFIQQNIKRRAARYEAV